MNHTTRIRFLFLVSLILAGAIVPEVSGFGSQGPTANKKLTAKLRAFGTRLFTTYRKVGDTCPGDCAFLGNGCYGEEGNDRIHSERAGGMTFDPFEWILGLPFSTRRRPTRFRADIAGDAADEQGALYLASLVAGAIKRPDLRGWKYTHLPFTTLARSARDCAPDNFTLLASVTKLSDVLRAVREDWSYVAYSVAVDEGFFTPRQAAVVKQGVEANLARQGIDADAAPCPATIAERLREEPRVGCADCALCFGRTGKRKVVAPRAKPLVVIFPTHGQSRARAAAAIR